MPDVRRIADHQSGFTVFRIRWSEFGKVGDSQVEPGLLPQFAGLMAIMRVDFIAPGCGNLALGKATEQRGIEGTSPESRVQKTNLRALRQQRPSIAKDVIGQSSGRGELAELVPLLRRSLRVQAL